VVAEESAESQSASTLPATHTVAAGENLYRIGLQYGMSWVTLAAYNNLPNANYVRVGQVLNIPGGTSTPPTQPPTTPPPTTPDEPGYTNYVVQPGDTLNSIGQKFGVSWIEIAEANGIVNPNLIYAGQVLKIPTCQPETPPSLTHTVQPGETLNRISLQYGVHWLAIAQANSILPPYVIYPGQVLIIPSG
jgi:LysM repeat protein